MRSVILFMGVIIIGLMTGVAYSIFPAAGVGLIGATIAYWGNVLYERER